MASIIKASPVKNTWHQGFTLIEVMITVAIVAILASIAVPAYNDYILRGRLVDATNALSATQAQMEIYFQDKRTYVGGPCATSQTVKTFTVVCSSISDLAYTITATGSGATAGFIYTINQVGDTTNTFPAAWGGATTNCKRTFLMKKGDTC